MTDDKSTTQEILDRLSRLRDELKLQMHLGSQDAKREWEELEKKWTELKSGARPVTDAVDETTRNVGAALGLAAEELRNGYERLAKLLRH